MELTGNLRYSIDPDARLVRLTYTGPASYEDWEAAMISVMAEPAYAPGYDFLVDRRDTTTISTRDLERMIAFVDLHVEALEGSRWAILVGRTADYGMGRMAQALAAGQPTTLEIFNDLDQALAWLGRAKA